MENIYNALGECVEIANLIDAIADGYLVANVYRLLDKEIAEFCK